MSDVEVERLKEGGVYTSQQLKKMERLRTIYKLYGTNYIQGGNIYSLEENGDKTFEVIKCMTLGVPHDT